MEDAGEVERVRNPEDGRSWLLALTDAGRQAAARVDRASAEHFRTVLSRLDPQSDPAPDVVLAALDALSRALRPPEVP